MTPTRPSTLALTAVLSALVAYLLARVVYGDLPGLPAFAPVPVFLLAVVELQLARTVRQRLRPPPGRGPLRSGVRPMHPMQVARAAVLAKASSAAGALLLGLYLGLLLHVLALDAQQARTDAIVSGVTLATALFLVGAALVLERACRTPDDPDDRTRADQ